MWQARWPFGCVTEVTSEDFDRMKELVSHRMLFDPAPAMELIERHQVTTTVMVPTMIAMMLDHPEFRPERLASMRMLTYGT